MAVSATSPSAPTASSRSVVKVAMPQRRGRALPTNAIRSAGVCRPSQCLPFGLAVIFTADASWAARAVSALGFAALGLRISRLLRFCDFAMSDVLPFVHPIRELIQTPRAARRDRSAPDIRRKIGTVTVGEGLEALTEVLDLAPIAYNVQGFGRGELD